MHPPASTIRSFLLSVPLLCVLNGCGSSANKSSATGQGGTVPGLSDAGGDATTTSSSTTDQSPLPLPFFVNAPGNFVKSGFMGDAGSTVVASPSATDSDGTCAGNRASASAGGDCDTFKINALPTGGMAWQGVFYQFPANNWGALPGRLIQSGAMSVDISARASRTVAVEFQIGMCDPTDATNCPDGFFKYPDTADMKHTVSIGTSWTTVTVSLAGVDYSKGVHGAVSWSIDSDDLQGDSSELDLYLDNLSWN